MGHKGHYGHYTGNARHSVNSWEEEDVKKGRKEEREGHKGYADALYDDAHGSYNYDGHNSTGAERKGPAQWNYNQAPSAAYSQYDNIPQHLRYGAMTAAALSNSEAGVNPYAGTGVSGIGLDSQGMGNQQNGAVDPTKFGINTNHSSEFIVNQNQSQNSFGPLAPPPNQRGESQKEKFVRHTRPNENWLG